MRHILIACLLLPCFVFAQKTKDHTVVVTEIANNIQSANFGKPSARLAVVTFFPVQGKTDQSNTFGEYLTESIIGKLSAGTDHLKLFERKRIDAILKENEFMLSGMIKASEAIKIGELLPIDALFSGTYTKLKNYVDVTGRLIDVASGEILMSYTGRIRLTKNIKTLFPETPTTGGTTVLVENDTKTSTSRDQTKTVSAEERCKQLTEKFREKLHDLSTTEKVDAVVSDAVRTPFENNCGKLHYHLIDALSRYGLFPAAYKKFLLATLDTIAYPSGDDRAYSILSYLTKDRNVDDSEWNSGFTTIRKVGDYTLSAYLGFMFNRVDQPDSTVLKSRADQYFDLLSRGQIGLPRPIVYDRGFYEMMESLTENRVLRYYLYGKYSGKLQTEPDNVTGLHLMYLKRLYNEETNPRKKTVVVSWIADYFNNHKNKKSPDQLFDFAREFMPYPNDEGSQFKIDRNKEAATKFPANDLSIMVEKCRDLFATYALETPYPAQKEERINFCVRNGIPIPGVIPSIAEARKVLQGTDIDEQLRVMRLLVMMDTKTLAPLEDTFVALLGKRSIDHRDKLTEIQALALRILGRLPTNNQKAITHMIASLKNYDLAGEISMEALVAIGKPAVKPLIDQLNATTIHDGGLQYRLVVILGRIGKDARAAAPALTSLMTKTTNKDIKYAIESALQGFE
jgi:TolB-like protein